MQQFDMKIAGSDEYPNRLRMLVVGPSGAGKTTLGSQFPNPLFVTAGGNLTTLARLGNVPYVEIGGMSDLVNLKLVLNRPEEERTELFGRKVESLVIDTVDGLQRVLLWEHVKDAGRNDTTAGDWGWVAERFHKIFSGLRQLDFHLLVLAHTKDVHYGDADAVIQPALGGAFVEGIHEHIDAAALLTAVQEESMESYMVRLKHRATEFGALRLGDSEQIEITAPPEAELTTVRYLNFSGTPKTPWAHDSTGAIPSTLRVDGATFLNIWERVNAVELSETVVVSVEVPEKVTTTEAPASSEAEATDDRDAIPVYTCTKCANEYTEKAWADLSNMKFKTILCDSCYKGMS